MIRFQLLLALLLIQGVLTARPASARELGAGYDYDSARTVEIHAALLAVDSSVSALSDKRKALILEMVTLLRDCPECRSEESRKPGGERIQHYEAMKSELEGLADQQRGLDDRARLLGECLQNRWTDTAALARRLQEVESRAPAAQSPKSEDERRILRELIHAAPVIQF